MTSTAAETIILAELLAAEPAYVSGTHLAATLGISRVAVWQHMERLRTAGFAFSAATAKGYRLTARPTHLHAGLIQAYRHHPGDTLALELLDEVESTNDEAARRLASGQPAPFALLARRQTRGRGRFGRVWHSRQEGNLYLSFGFRPQLEPARMTLFTLWMGANLAELIAHFTREAPGLKWPNDLLLGPRKVGGMLTEARIDADHIRDLVFGLGLNLLAPPDGWPPELADRAAALADHTRQPLDANRFTAALLGRVLTAYNQFLQGDYTDKLAALWQRYDVLRGRPITVLQGDRQLAGTALGIDAVGALLIRTAAGRTERFLAGEVTLAKT